MMSFLLLAASVAAGAGVAYLSVWVIRLITGNPNGWTELGIWVWFLAIPSILGGVLAMFPRLGGYHVVANQTEVERLWNVRTGWTRVIGKSGVFLVVFLCWPEPDLTSKVAAVVIWIAWLLLAMHPQINRMSRLKWREWEPEPRTPESQHPEARSL